MKHWLLTLSLWTYLTLGLPTALRGQTLDSARNVSLGEVAIEGQTLPRYRDSLSTGAARIPVPLLQLPQAVQVVAPRVWQDQGSGSLNEVSRNLAGLVSVGGTSNYVIRGFQNWSQNNFIAVDGLRGNPYSYLQSPLLFNVERVEAIRGPASVLC